jgi:hypothetical protein
LLREDEEVISRLYRAMDGGSLDDSQIHQLKEVEAVRHELQAKEEQTWRLKSRALWLKAGDNNLKFFHQYTNLHKNINMIWEISIEDGSKDLLLRRRQRRGVVSFNLCSRNQEDVPYMKFFRSYPNSLLYFQRK